MKTVALRKLVVVAEAVLEDKLVRDFRHLGARGFTIMNCRGEGNRGVRTSDAEGNNVRFEVLLSPESADRILARLADHYFPHYAVVAWIETVEVIRGDKYV